MNYGNIIRDSFNIFWKHKILWLFGIILALVGQGEYGFSVNYQERYSYPTGKGEIPDIPNPFDNSFFRSFFENPLPYIIGFGILALLWWVISNFVGWLSQGALIGMVDEIEHTGTTSIRSGWQVGKNRVKTLFSLAVVFALPQLIIFLPVFIGVFLFFSQFLDVFGPGFSGKFPAPEQMEQKMASIFPLFFAGFACFFPLMCIGNIIGWVLGLLNKIAARSCVLENLGMVDSIKRAWYITRKNIGYTLLNWFILVVISGIFGLVGAMLGLVLWMPTGRALLHNEWSTLSIVTAILMGFYFLIVVIVIGGILNSFNSTLWTKLYQEFLIKEGKADIANAT